jgi:hypothetical protein
MSEERERKGVMERNSERGREGGREGERIERERARESDGIVCMYMSPAPLSKQEDDGVAGVAGTNDDLPEITPHESVLQVLQGLIGVAGVAGTKDDLPEITPHEPAHTLYASKERESARALNKGKTSESDERERAGNTDSTPAYS